MQDSSEVRAKIFNLQLFGKERENMCSSAKNHTNMKLPQASKFFLKKRKKQNKNLFTKHNANVIGCEKPKCQKHSSYVFKLTKPTLCTVYLKYMGELPFSSRCLLNQKKIHK